MTLTEFLLARIAEDEAAAERLELCPYFGVDVGSGHVHISRARAMAECEAKRRIVDEHRWAEPGRDAILRILAAVYADHTDCREEWRP